MRIYRIKARWVEGEYTQYHADKSAAQYMYRLLKNDPEAFYVEYAELYITCYHEDALQFWSREGGEE